jgi:hypothetical protein
LVGEGNKWGFVWGLLGQPFWFWTTIKKKEWGIFILSVAYAILWTKGVWKFFIAPLLM